MSHKKTPPKQGFNGPPENGRLTHGSEASYLAGAKQQRLERIIPSARIFHKYQNLTPEPAKILHSVKIWHTFLQSLFASPQLSCSGAVLRYQFKLYPKPNSTHPRALSRSHYWHLAVSPFWAEGTYHIRLWSSYQAVGRGVAIPKTRMLGGLL